MSNEQQIVTAEYLTELLKAGVTGLTESGIILTEREAFLYSAGAAWALQVALLQQSQVYESSQMSQLLTLIANLVGELHVRNQIDLQKTGQEQTAIAEKFATHALPQATPMVTESSTHRENNASIPEDDIYDVGGVKYLKNNSQTPVSGHKRVENKSANKATRGGVSYTPDTLCLDTGFKQCVEAGMSKSKLAERFGVSESTVARAKRMLKTGK